MRHRFLFLTAAMLFMVPSLFASRITAWIPAWDSAALTSLQLNAGRLDESNPVWYSLSSTGSIVLNWNAENPTWVAAMTGTKVIPTIQNVVDGSFNGTVAETLLAKLASPA